MEINDSLKKEMEVEMLEILSKFIDLNESFFSKRTLEHLKEMLEVVRNDETIKKNLTVN